MALLPSTDPASWSLKDVSSLIQNAIDLAILLAGGVAVIYLLIGAFNYFTAFGNEEKATNAKKIITWSLIGAVVIVIAKVLIAEIWHFVTPVPVEFPK